MFFLMVFRPFSWLHRLFRCLLFYPRIFHSSPWFASRFSMVFFDLWLAFINVLIVCIVFANAFASKVYSVFTSVRPTIWYMWFILGFHLPWFLPSLPPCLPACLPSFLPSCLPSFIIFSLIPICLIPNVFFWSPLFLLLPTPQNIPTSWDIDIATKQTRYPLRQIGSPLRHFQLCNTPYFGSQLGQAIVDTASGRSVNY